MPSCVNICPSPFCTLAKVLNLEALPARRAHGPPFRRRPGELCSPELTEENWGMIMNFSDKVRPVTQLP